MSDLYRFCIYCEADCEGPDPEHTDGCPFSTDVWPVSGEEPGGVACMDCGHPFAPGAFYTHRWIEEDVGEVICLGCAALEELAA